MSKLLAFERRSTPLETVLARRRDQKLIVYLREPAEEPMIPVWLFRAMTALTWMALGVACALFFQLVRA